MITGRYRVPKRKVRVRVHTPQTGIENLSFFLSDQAETHNGRECPSDLLNGSDDFVVCEDDEGQIVFLHRRAITRVTVATEEEMPEDPLTTDDLLGPLAKNVRVAVHLENGECIEGVAHYELPEAQSRVQDFLNTSQLFIPVHGEHEIELVNRIRILRVVQL